MIPNQIFESESWLRTDLNAMMVLIWLYKIRRTNDGGYIDQKTNRWVEVKENEWVGSLSFLANRFNKSINTTRKILKSLEKGKFIRVYTSRKGTKIKFNLFLEHSSKIDTNLNTHFNTNSKQTLNTYNTKNTTNTKKKHFSEKYIVSKSGTRVARCSKCGKKEFPKDDWAVNQGSTCCREPYVAKWDKLESNNSKKNEKRLIHE